LQLPSEQNIQSSVPGYIQAYDGPRRIRGHDEKAKAMAVYKQKNSKQWWYKFSWNGQLIRAITKQTNKRTAEQIEAARKTQLAKGEVGIHTGSRFLR